MGHIDFMCNRVSHAKTQRSHIVEEDGVYMVSRRAAREVRFDT